MDFLGCKIQRIKTRMAAVNPKIWDTRAISRETCTTSLNGLRTCVMFPDDLAIKFREVRFDEADSTIQISISGGAFSVLDKYLT